MDEILSSAKKLNSALSDALAKLNIEESQQLLNKLKQQAIEADFWQNNVNAQENLKQQAKIEAKIGPWLHLHKEVSDILELAATKDKSLIKDLAQQLQMAQNNFEKLKESLKLSGLHDINDVILSIYAGAGGTDAQDWAQMLLRMYLRWAQSKNYKTKIIEESAGEEAGIKSVTLEVNGDFAYGHLRGEHGVHRLVRLSPFNADNLRQTSFAKVDVLPRIDSPAEIEIEDKDLKIDVYRSGGHGGQSVNTTDSAVRLTHLPTGITVAIQNERSQLQNKETAMVILRSRLMQLKLQQHAQKLDQLKGPSTSAEWGNQIRNYVLHPYKQVKDLRSGYETSDPDPILNGKLDDIINAYLEFSLSH